jgi:hypothetical protein
LAGCHRATNNKRSQFDKALQEAIPKEQDIFAMAKAPGQLWK